ncbi:MAG: hypothetical protein IJU99_03550 [Lachnospiraceae bacterium]|nr:hypothetical protein [Lachnospiraceae bacterium]
MNRPCYICEHESEFSYQAMEVLTFHIRDLSGHRRIQGIGDYVSASVCRDCATKRLDEVRNPYRKPKILQLLMVPVIVLGMILITSFGKYGAFFISTGVLFVAGGLLYLAGSFRTAAKRKAEFDSYRETEALEKAGWDLLCDRLPKKAGENNITYIPINPQTMRRKNGDLMILYNLLPENAVEIHRILHRDFTGQGVRKETEENHE